MDLLAAIDAERRTEERVVRWLDALPDKFSRIPGDSRSKSQPQLNNMERTIVVKIEAEEYIKLIEPDRQELLAYFVSEDMKEKEQRHKNDTEEQPNRLPAKQFEAPENEPRSKQHEEMKELYPAEADLSPVYGPPPPIPPRSLLRPRPSIATFSETAPGTTQHANAINASSSQYSSVVPNEATASGMGSSVARDLESGSRRDNPALVAELRRGMERRRQRESAKNEELEKGRQQELSVSKVWGLKLWK
ncbi:hypothetical protein VE03_10810 [Pseudogymnoascus sp. 23342-1-I1]|nr:hypothetical protein VE03_10810 [Pseudogymnoascus sp. 23342-1-I1]